MTRVRVARASIASAVLALLAASAHAREASPPRERAPDPSWSLALEVGAEFLLLDGTGLGDELQRFGYEHSQAGPALGATLERALSSWLDLGVGIGWASHTDIRQDRRPHAKTRLDRVSARTYLSASYCIIDACSRDFAIDFGAQLGLGGGVTLWELGGETTSAPHLSLEPALLWNLWLQCWGLGVRLSYAFVAIDELGPLRLSTSLSWTPSVNARILFRW